MSRIGKSPIEIPDGVSVDIKNHIIIVVGRKGSLEFSYNKSMTVTKSNGNLIIDRSTDGAFLSFTDCGLPDRITPIVFFDIFSNLSKGIISDFTLSSLTLLAISCVYWEPKSIINRTSFNFII